MRINQRIRVREVLVIGPDGASLGVMPTGNAIELAMKSGLDLVEISPNARPPVCKILEYGKFKYEMAKKEKDKKTTTANKVKELKFHLNIDSHDYLVKMRHAESFLLKGMKVKLMMVLRGREMMRKEDAEARVEVIRKDLEHAAIADNIPKLVGRNINLMLTPLPANKRKARFTSNSDMDADEETGAEDIDDNSGES
ncbi:MAG: translation initiation factor IF-3 [Candidatus Methylacidiphilales bacterium]